VGAGEDLAVVDRSLRANRGARIADGALSELRRRVELFGLHLAKLDVRVHAGDPDEKLRALFAAAERVRRRHGEQALDTVIVSGTSTSADILRARDSPTRRCRSCRCSRRSTTSAQRRASSGSCSTNRVLPRVVTGWR